MNFPYITEQLRTWDTRTFFQIVSDYLLGHVLLKNFPMSRVKGESQPCNAVDTLKSFLQLDKKYPIGEHNYNGSAIIEKVELHLLKNEKAARKGTVISDGRHRALAMVVAEAFGAPEVEPVYVDVEEDNVRTNSFEMNVAHDKAAKLSKVDKLKEVIGLIDSKEAQKEADIQKLGLTRYQAQEFWAKAMLCRQHDFSVEEAAGLKKELAREASKQADAREYVDGETKGAAGKNAAKVVSGKVIREVVKLLQESGVPSEDSARKVLEAIATGDEVGLRDLAFSIIKANK